MADRSGSGKTRNGTDGIDEDEMSAVSQIKSAQKKGGAKKIIFILILVIFILGGGFAAYHFLFSKNNKNSKTSGKPAAFSPQKTPGPMMGLKPFLTNLADRGATSYIKVSISIELKQGANTGLFKKLIPEIRNNIIMILNSKTSGDVKNPEGIISLRHQIARSLNRVLGSGTVIGVYFNNYLVQ